MMQEALPYKTWTILAQYNPQDKNRSVMNKENEDHPIPRGHVKTMVSENAVIVLAKRGCCMTHVVTLLLQGLGVNPAVREIGDLDEDCVVDELQVDGSEGRMQFPAVFIGGELFGGLDRLMTSHISGELIPVLKQAGALWL